MAGGIPEEIIQQVREAADIVEVISEHIPLKQSGKNFKAICPFHQERTPSFIVSPEKQIYHCFGCGAGGNVFNFLMEMEKISFVEAVRELAKRYGIKIPDVLRTKSPDESLGYKINAMVARLYRKLLLATKEGMSAREYLRRRKVDEKTEEAFLLGYAPSEGNSIVEEAKLRKIDLKRVCDLGLVIEKEGTYRDVFRRRLIFPIASPSGRVVGFGGRVLDQSEPKYLNSPETGLFKKSESLYGIYSAKKSITTSGNAIIVEGYMDVIALHASGFPNTVGSLGTAFTIGQARQLRRYCEAITIVYDGDEAGRIASLRACQPALEAGLKVRIAQLPEGNDPDSFVRENGHDAFLEILNNSSYHYIDFVLNFNKDEPEDAIKLCLRLVSTIKDPIRKALDLRMLSERSGLPVATLEKGIDQILSRSVKSEGERKISQSSCDKVEKSILSLLIDFPEYQDRLFEAVSPSDFEDPLVRQLVEAIFDKRSKGLDFSVSSLLSEIDDPETRSFLTSISVSEELSANPGKVIDDYIASIKRKRISKEIESLRVEIRIAEKEGDAEKLRQLLKKRQELANELNSLVR